MHTDLADDLPTVPRFMHSFRQCKALVVTHGVYTTYAGTTVFSRAPMERDSTKDATAKELALSFAAAQDCAGSAQIEGVSDEDLDVFRRLWESTIAALETVIEAGNLDHETFGWGIFGFSSGYVGKPSWRDDSQFLALKTRLHDALQQMPNMDAHRRRSAITKETGGKVEVLAKTNREIHVCANLLLQQFRREKWNRIRWYHGVAVAERWIRNLGLESEVVGTDVAAEKG
jgi:hypothetical protein